MRVETNRLELHEISSNDKDNLIPLFTDTEVIMHYMFPDFKSEEEKLKLFNRFVELSNKDDNFMCGIYLKNSLIGFIHMVSKENNSIELGYVISPKHKNNGYATEALKGAIDKLFDLGYKNVKAGAFVENLASIRVMEKAGMVKISFEEDIMYRDLLRHCVYYEIKKGLIL